MDVFDGYKSIGKMEKSEGWFQKRRLKYTVQSQTGIRQNRQLNDAENKVSLSKLI
jgi:hypothetical protein